MFTATKGKALLTTTTGALPRPSWYTANLRGMPLSYGLSQAAYREQHFDCLACNVVARFIICTAFCRLVSKNAFMILAMSGPSSEPGAPVLFHVGRCERQDAGQVRDGLVVH